MSMLPKIGHTILGFGFAALSCVAAMAQSDGSGAPQGTEYELPFALDYGVHLDAATVMQAQQALSAAGYDVGDVDGSWGSKSHQAMMAFQAAQGLAPTGNMNLRSLAALGVTPAGATIAADAGQSPQGGPAGQDAQNGSAGAEGAQSGPDAGGLARAAADLAPGGR